MNRLSNLRQQRPNEKAFCVMKMMCLYAAHSILFARDMRHLTTILHLNSKNTGLPYLTSTFIILFLLAATFGAVRSTYWKSVCTYVPF